MNTGTRFFRLRILAAALITLSGAGQVAQLWFRDLSGTAVAEAVLGIAYILVGIGLLGQSRFTLFVAIVVPALAATRIIDTVTPQNPGALLIARVAVDVIVVLCCVIELLRVRKPTTTRHPAHGDHS